MIIQNNLKIVADFLVREINILSDFTIELLNTPCKYQEEIIKKLDKLTLLYKIGSITRDDLSTITCGLFKQHNYYNHVCNKLNYTL